MDPVEYNYGSGFRGEPQFRWLTAQPLATEKSLIPLRGVDPEESKKHVDQDFLEDATRVSISKPIEDFGCNRPTHIPASQ